MRSRDIRERVALRIAPWLYVPYRQDREEAFKDLAEVAYLSRDAVWTSPRVLVKTALEVARSRGISFSELDAHMHKRGFKRSESANCILYSRES